MLPLNHTAGLLSREEAKTIQRPLEVGAWPLLDERQRNFATRKMPDFGKKRMARRITVFGGAEVFSSSNEPHSSCHSWQKGIANAQDRHRLAGHMVPANRQTPRFDWGEESAQDFFL
jgi:hypothetical protein